MPPGGETRDGSDGSDTGPDGKAPPTANNACPVEENYGSAGTSTTVGYVWREDPNVFESRALRLLLTLQDPDGPADVLFVELYEGYGAMSGGIVPGTYSIEGAETWFPTCGVCAYILSDFDGVNGSSTSNLQASAGVVTIDEVDAQPGGMVVGRVSGLRFREVMWDEAGNQSDVPEGCTSSITKLGFVAQLTLHP
jgi:hypothetical protein